MKSRGQASLLGERVLSLPLAPSFTLQPQHAYLSAPRTGHQKTEFCPGIATPDIHLQGASCRRTESQAWETSRPENPFLPSWPTKTTGKRAGGKALADVPQGAGPRPCREGLHRRPHEMSPAGPHCPAPLSHCHGYVTRTPLCKRTLATLLIKCCVQNAGRREARHASSC